MSACGQDTAHLDTHEEYTQELNEKLDSEQEHFKELDSSIKEIETAIFKLEVLTKSPSVL